MRKAFTLIELMAIVAIIGIIASIMIPIFSVQARHIKPGNNVMWNGQKVRIIAIDRRTEPTTYLIRLEDNKELKVTYDELSPIVKAEKE